MKPQIINIHQLHRLVSENCAFKIPVATFELVEVVYVFIDTMIHFRSNFSCYIDTTHNLYGKLSKTTNDTNGNVCNTSSGDADPGYNRSNCSNATTNHLWNRHAYRNHCHQRLSDLSHWCARRWILVFRDLLCYIFLSVRCAVLFGHEE